MRVMRVVVADDHTLVTESLRMLLEKDAEIQVVATAYDGRDALKKCQELAPDLVLMDIKMPLMDGVEAACLIKKTCPGTKVAILTSLENSKYVLQSLLRGADAYILKDTPPETLKVLMQCICWGFYVLSGTARDLLQSELLHCDEIMVPRRAVPFKEEDLAILRHLSAGKNNREIGELLGYAEGTIKNKITRLMETVKVENRAQLVVYALKNDLL